MNWNLLLQFCRRDGTRLELATPFVRGGFIYATDARIILKAPNVRVGGSELQEIKYINPEALMPPFEHNLDLLMDGAFSDTGVPIPDFNPVWKTCRACVGEGFGASVGCHECDYEPRWVSDEVGDAVAVGGQIFGQYYLHMMRAYLTDVLCFNNVKPGQPMKFTFLGGEGRLMPMRDFSKERSEES